MKHLLCFDIQYLELGLPNCYEIVHTLEGDPMRVYKIKRKDTAPSLRAYLQNETTGERIGLTSLNPLKFLMKEQFYYKFAGDEEIKVQNSENITLLDQQNLDLKGGFEYNWQQENTDCPGIFRGEFQILLNGVESAAEDTFELANGLVLTVSIDEGANQNITFLTADFVDITKATPAEIVSKINTILGNTYASIIETNRIYFQTRTTELSGSVNVVGGTANDVLQFSTGLVPNRRISLPERGLEIRVLPDLDDN